MIVVKFPNCSVVYVPGVSVHTMFNDGASWGAYPHPEMPHYHVIAHRCGYGDDLWRYCFEHEVVHAYLAERAARLGVQGVVDCLAHGVTPDAAHAAAEEIVVHTVQRWLRANERPIVAGVDWDGMKANLLNVIDGAQS